MKVIDFFHRKVVNFFIRLTSFRCTKSRTKRKIKRIILYYRICDKGRPKDKPDYITKEKCFSNAIRVFPTDQVEWHVIADNICEETYKMLMRYIPSSSIKRVSIGSGSGTFRLAYEDAINNDSNDLIYFLEDDYLHTSNALQGLIEVAECNNADYYTLYDHPDKYGNESDNPYVNNGGENTSVFWCVDRHWKLTNSTTMTFAAFVDVLKRDKKTFWRWTSNYLPMDFNLFMDLRFFKHAKLMCPIPSYSTHCENAYLAYGIDWAKE